MNRNVIITCALTGAGDTVGRSEHVPVTPEQIAESGIAAARAGAAIVHVHVRDPETGKGSRDVALYREAVERIRASDVDVIVNTTAGMGGDLVLDPQDPTTFVDGTDLVNGVERLAHVEELLPDICTLDCGSLNFGEGSLVYVSTPDMLRDGAKQHPGARRPRRDGDLRHRPPVVRQAAGRRGADRRARDVPALHGDPVRRPRRPGDAGRHGQPAARGRGLGVVRARRRCRCRGWPSRSCSAATCAWGSRTTSTCARA